MRMKLEIESLMGQRLPKACNAALTSLEQALENPSVLYQRAVDSSDNAVLCGVKLIVERITAIIAAEFLVDPPLDRSLTLEAIA